jgi:CxC2 like cysteine cluster associated with KDZ transposases
MFHTLETFELLSYVSKVSPFEYYQVLSRLTDNTGFNVPNVSNASFFFP